MKEIDIKNLDNESLLELLGALEGMNDALNTMGDENDG